VNAPARPSLPAMLAALSVPEARELIRDVLVEVLPELQPEAGRVDDGLLDRAGAARYLGISLAKLDGLCRRDEDPLPWSLCGDSRRFFREDLAIWVRRQRGGKAT
jgi:hypothetical protein